MRIKRALIDFNSLCFSVLYGQVMKDDKLYTDEDRMSYFNYAVLNRLAMIQKKLQVNETIICCESRSWRRDYFQYYKAQRDLHKAEKPVETKFMFDCINGVLDIIRNLNYKVMKVEGCEADDIIAVLCQTFTDSQIVIISVDKDFQQLTNDNIVLYNWSKDEVLNCEDKDRFIIELILKGDTADGIPNVLSDDDTFVVKEKRQKPMTKKKINEILEMGIDNYAKTDMQFAKNFDRNRKLILLDESTIPGNIYSTIKATYNNLTQNFKRKNIVEINEVLRKFKVAMMDNINYLV
ncbi:hypothetical protein J6W34_09245 [bacterium]|nr:hypothetical protein [bacterium]